MFRRTLVPVDFTPKNERSLAVASELAAGEGGELLLLHVVETLEDELDDDLDAFYRRLAERAQERLNALLARLGEAAFARRGEVVLGHRARAIVAYAEREQVDLIVLSSHRVDPDRPGSDWVTISHKVAILARCPVLLVK
ncbi:MAG TPA: universal stress protein [Thermoanaerobaculia bacterium]|nr:universal stress protein [Thermoanaerobaculia bacterium]